MSESAANNLLFDTVCFFWWGLLSQSHDNEHARPSTQGPEPSAARRAPRAFSTGVVDSLGEGFALKLISELICTRWVGFGPLT